MLTFAGQEVHTCFSFLERCLMCVADLNACYKQLKFAVLSDGAAFTTDHRAMIHREAVHKKN